MRFRSPMSGGFQVFAVAGINTVSFGIKATAEAQKGLLGFGVVRKDPKEGESYTMPGFKVFPSAIPYPDESTRVSTMDHPVQSFVWDDFTAKDDHTTTSTCSTRSKGSRRTWIVRRRQSRSVCIPSRSSAKPRVMCSSTAVSRAAKRTHTGSRIGNQMIFRRQRRRKRVDGSVAI